MNTPLLNCDSILSRSPMVMPSISLISQDEARMNSEEEEGVSAPLEESESKAVMVVNLLTGRPVSWI